MALSVCGAGLGGYKPGRFGMGVCHESRTARKPGWIGHAYGCLATGGRPFTFSMYLAARRTKEIAQRHIGIADLQFEALGGLQCGCSRPLPSVSVSYAQAQAAPGSTPKWAISNPAATAQLPT